MAHDIFISHSTEDKATADAICHLLEQSSIRCWIAPRDIRPGSSYSGEIIRGIKGCSIFLLIFSSSSNLSKDVLREVQNAINETKHIIPFRIEKSDISDDLSYYLAGLHWLDAYPDKDKFSELVKYIRSIVKSLPEKSNLEIPNSKKDVNKEPVNLGEKLVPGSNLSGINLRGRDLSNIDFSECELSKAILMDSILVEAKLINVILSNANLENANLEGADLNSARIDYANLKGAKLENANLYWARLTRSDLRGAILRKTNFHLADLKGTNFSDADASSAVFNSALMLGADFRNTILCKADFTLAEIDGIQLQGANLTDVIGLTNEQIRTAIIDENTIIDSSYFIYNDEET